MGSWHCNLGPGVSLNPMEEGGSRVMLYLSGASFLLPLFCHPGPRSRCPHIQDRPSLGQHSKTSFTDGMRALLV